MKNNSLIQDAERSVKAVKELGLWGLRLHIFLYEYECMTVRGPFLDPTVGYGCGLFSSLLLSVSWTIVYWSNVADINLGGTVEPESRVDHSLTGSGEL